MINMSGLINSTETYVLVALGVLLIVSIIAFVVMLIDKRRSNEQGALRIPEGVLFFLAAAFGSLGIYLGMYSLRHKTRKWYFVVGIPLLLLQNFLVIYFLAKL